MATTSALIQRARLELGDLPQTFQTRVNGDGVTQVVTLQYKPVNPASLTVVKVSGVTQTNLVSGVHYTLDAAAGSMTFTTPLTSSEYALISGSAFRYFSDVDWTTFVDTAVLQHFHQREGVNLANVEPVEDYPIALLAVTEALYALINDAAFDIDIYTPEGVNIPRHQRYEQLMQLLVGRLDQYNKLSSALNVGLGRIEMFDLRRKSRTTNKLIPIYREQELEDTRMPTRIFVPIDLGGGMETPDTVVDFPLAIIQSEPFTASINLAQNITGKTVKATLRRYKGSGAVAYFTVDVLDAPTGAITCSFTAERTYTFGGGPYWWDVRVISNGVAYEVLEGVVTIEPRPRT